MGFKKLFYVTLATVAVLSIQLGFNSNKVFAADKDWIIKDQILSSKIADVNGDGIEEKIVLSSHYSNVKCRYCMKKFKLSIINFNNGEVISEKEIFENKETTDLWGIDIWIGRYR